MKRNNRGISLIVLVITVIVMIILAGSVIISLSNSGIIGKANEAVDANNLKQVEQLAMLAWSEAYIDRLTDKTVDLEARVEEALEKNKVDQTKYAINVTESGVSVKTKTTLGTLVASANDYGKTVDYTVTVDGTEYKDWRVLYEDEANGYVYIISTYSLYDEPLENSGASLSATEKALYKKFQVGNWPSYTFTDGTGSAVAQLIKNYGDYANKTLYGETNVIGAIGGPTIELIAAGWNAKGYEPTLTVDIVGDGYAINGNVYLAISGDGLYILESYYNWLASPSVDGRVLYAGDSNVRGIGSDDPSAPYGLRPVICLSSSIPACEGDTTDFSLVKSK